MIKMPNNNDLPDSRKKKRTSSEVKDIPGRIPLSDIASVIGSNNDLNETQKLASTTD
jgi:hypothetical protein